MLINVFKRKYEWLWNGLVARADFLFLVLVVCCINLPYLRHNFMPVHDTLFCYEVFYNMYNEFFYHNEIVQWMPYEVYGVPYAFWQIGSLTPVDYFVCCMGKIFAFKDTLVLFKLAVLLNQFVFLLGMYFLTDYIFKKKITTILVCLGCFCSLVWFSQVCFNFRMYYYLPWVLYFILLFCRWGQAYLFWMACFTGVLWAIGTSWYFSILWLLVICVFCCALFLLQSMSFNKVVPRSLGSWFWMGAFFVFLASYLVFLKSSFDYMRIWGRAPEGFNSLEVFLTHGGKFSFDALITYFTYGGLLYTNAGARFDNTIYLGLLIIFFFIWAAIFVRNRVLYAFLITFVVLVWISFGGLCAIVAYYIFPGFKYYRHLGLIYGLVKIIMALCAGFGISDIFQSTRKEALRKTAVVLLAYFLLIDMSDSRDLFPLLFNISASNDFFVKSFTLRAECFITFIFISFSILFVYLLRMRLNKQAMASGSLKNFFAVFFVGILLVDIVSFQRSVFLAAPVFSHRAQANIKAVEVNKLEFVAQRSQMPQGARQKMAWNLEEELGYRIYGKYDSLFGFTQTDFCRDAITSDIQRTPLLLRDVLKDDLDDGKVVLAGAGVDRVNTSLVISRVMSLAMAQIPQNLAYNSIIGCGQPKIRVLDSALFFKDEESIKNYMRTHENFDKTALFQSSAMTNLSKTQEYKDSPSNFFVRSFKANEISIDVDIKRQGGAWLTYADAFHPGWHAFVDNEPTTIYPAYLAFKGIFIPGGKHVVRFVFFNGIVSFLSYFIAFVGAVTGACFVAIFFLKIFVLYDLETVLKRKDYT